MKCVFLMFDSLNRHLLEAYGGGVPTPNFTRLAQKTATFDRHFVGSLPCMPARRDLMTGRLSFLHRSWGPLEPFDNAVPELLAKAGVYSHLITDHAHYWEDGGAGYHNRYDSYELVRGQEGDPWKAWVAPPVERLRERWHPAQFDTARRNYKTQNIHNRELSGEDARLPSTLCFDHAFEFLDRNRDADEWLLQLETFDPHEPFTAPEHLKRRFDTGWNGPIRDWPPYARVTEDAAEAAELRANYHALVAHCDEQLGRLLDYFDTHDLWKNTALIVTTDHGYLLGEHDFWAKNRMTLYAELCRIPLFVHDPRRPETHGTRRQALTQTIDLAPTLLSLFGAEAPPEMQGFDLLPVLDQDRSPRAAALFGYFGGAVNVTDGRWTYHRYPPDLKSQEIYQYTVMPAHIWCRFSTEELSLATLAPPFSFTKNVPLLKVPVIERSPMYDNYGPGGLIENTTVLYDLETDPAQENPLADPAIEARMAGLMRELMIANDCPPEALARVGLEQAPA